ncbi:MAG TPA: response regulator [Candidatus Methylacidiphilales bacterium]|nr:response regulator [Candidatus Methylacidiphilales bacterium]
MSLESDTSPAPARLPSGTIPRLPVHRPGNGSRPPSPASASGAAPVLAVPYTAPVAALLIPTDGSASGTEPAAMPVVLRKETSRMPLPVRTFATPPSIPPPAASPALPSGPAGAGNGSVSGPQLPSPQESPLANISMMMQPKRIIVIDDDESLTFTFKLALESRGHIVETENRGVRAIDAIERFAPDVIFLDIIMPGSDGGEVYTRLRSLPRLASIPVVFLTAMVTREEARQGIPNERGLRYLSKPASIDDVEKAIALIFGL